MKFACQDSCGGKCCSKSWVGSDSHVFLTSDDQKRISFFLKRPLAEWANLGEFIKTRFSSFRSLQWFIRMDKTGTCSFFKDGKCGIHEVRPVQCRTFPYWPENIKEGAIRKEVAEICPGVGEGSDSYAEFYLKMQREADGELRKNIGKRIL